MKMHSHASTPIISASNLILNDFGKSDTHRKKETEEVKEQKLSNNYIPEVI